MKVYALNVAKRIQLTTKAVQQPQASGMVRTVPETNKNFAFYDSF